ncbi:hypothetical protein H4R20_005735 [Coemansia guatemalensis]|uniref:Uncharacterized protein n=1 Tax=Coemansia guatemalensis TaxID=2761395 RepID=A0A9W8HW55_9FUNG|nr:hypothetical protein H4R20_005735 [Coemansia guatemalensis]
MTAKSRRTAAPVVSNALDGSKTVAAGTRVKSANIDKLVATKLFADAADTSESVDRIEDSAPTAESVAPSPPIASEPETTTTALPKEPAKSPIKSTQVEQQEPAEKSDAQEPDSTLDTEDQAVSVSPTKSEVAVADATKPSTSTNSASAKQDIAASKSMHKPKSSAGTSTTGKGISGKQKQSESSTSARPTLIPKSKRAAKPSASQQPGKLHAGVKEKSKSSSDSDASSLAATKKGSNGNSKPAQNTAPAKQLPSHKPMSYRNVESKIKSYINAKPATASKPKTKLGASSTTNVASKQAAPTSKQAPKSTISKKAAAPNAAQHDKKKDEGDKSVPSYMRSTKATEIRSQKQNIKPTTSGSSRFAPYARPAKQPKQTIAN